MNTEKKRPSIRMILLIATPKLTRKAAALFQESGVPIYYQFHGKGTASSEVTDLLGFGNIDKKILLSIMPKVFADKMMKKIRKEMRLNTQNSGIVCSVVMSGGSGMIINKLNELNGLEDENCRQAAGRSGMEMTEYSYAMIMVIANQGYSEDVMDAARSAGASGGTVIHARQAVNEETIKFWGIQIQPEREITIILAPQEEKMEIMKAVGKKCGVHSEARGVVFSLPVDSVIGLD